jgi:lactate 2-monooxygenase
MQHFGDYQTEIYMAGLAGVTPALPVDHHTLEARAASALSPQVLSYVQGGCGDEQTQRRNVEAFGDWGVIPRMMVDCSKRDLSVDLLGLRLPSPVFLCPIGVTGLCTQDGHGDLAAAEASRMTGVPLMASTLSNDPLERVAEAAGDVPAFFQLYTPKDRDLALSLIARAERAGYKGLVVTLDTWVTGWRPRDLNASNFPQLRGHVLENYFSDPRFRQMLEKPPEVDRRAAIMTWVSTFGHVLTWKDLRWLRQATSMPLILKGICHPDDAKRAVDEGVDAIYCSNHGGRQANGGIAAINPSPFRFGRPLGIRRNQGFGTRRPRGRGRSSLPIWSCSWWRGRRCSCAPQYSGGSRSAHGSRRLSQSCCSSRRRSCARRHAISPLWVARILVPRTDLVRSRSG